MKRVYGWRKDTHDQRDLKFLYTFPNHLPLKVDLRHHCPPVYDQGSLGSCTANAIAGQYDFCRIKAGLPPITPSRLFIYYNERDMEGTVDYDAGAQIRDGIKSVAQLGVCEEICWPYDTKKFDKKPNPECYDRAMDHQSITYASLRADLRSIKNCLAGGFPFVFGFTVYESFEGKTIAETGLMPFPGKKEKPIGGHAIEGVGYNDLTKTLICRNSWGGGWGDKGYFYMPYDVITRGMCHDFWVIRRVE